MSLMTRRKLFLLSMLAAGFSLLMGWIRLSALSPCPSSWFLVASSSSYLSLVSLMARRMLFLLAASGLAIFVDWGGTSALAPCLSSWFFVASPSSYPSFVSLMLRRMLPAPGLSLE